MLQEINNFMNTLSPELKQAGLKPKEGLHVLLKVQEKDGVLFMDEKSVEQVCLTRKATEFDEPFLQRCAELAQVSWCVNTNKCFDLPAKGIHSCSPYCVALKRESLEGGGKYSKDKIKIYDRVEAYFTNAVAFVVEEEEKERISVFRNFINSREKLNALFGYFQADFEEVKDKEYIILYLDEAIEKYRQVNEWYLSDKLFNTNEFNVKVGNEIYGTSDFLNGFPTKKPFLSHQSAVFDIAGRITGEMARNLHSFQEIMLRNILPRPLPLFVYREELQTEELSIFSKYLSEGKKIGYQEIIRELYGRHKEDIGDYYLLYYYGNTVCDFDFVSQFRYELKQGDKKYWEIKDYFQVETGKKIFHVFELEDKVLRVIFNNSLITQTKAGDIQRKYFDELDSKYCKSENNYLLVLKYRKAFYDYIYKSRIQAVTRQMFDDILLSGVLEDIRLDEMKENQHSQRWSVLNKMNIWFSLTENFDVPSKITNTMASKLEEQRAFMVALSEGKAALENDEQYAFAVGQVIYYLLHKSKTADKSYKRLEPFLQQVHASELNKAVARLFDMYKHENFSGYFRHPFASVMAYQTKANMREYLPMMLAGIFSDNQLFAKDKSEDTDEEN